MPQHRIGRWTAVVVVLAVLARSTRAAEPDAGPVVVVPEQKHVVPNAQSVAVSPDGKFVAAGFGGPTNGRFPLRPTTGRVVVWEAHSGRPVRVAGEYGDIVRVQFAHDAAALLVSRVHTPGDSIDDDATRLVDIKTGENRQSWDAAVAAASPVAGLFAVVRGRDVCRLFRSDELPIPRGEERGRAASLDGARNAVALEFSPDGKQLVAVHARLEPHVLPDGSISTTVRVLRTTGLSVFDAATVRLLRTVVRPDLADCAALSVAPSAKRIATGHETGVVRVWDGATLERVRVLDLPTKGATCPTFSPDGRLMAVLAQSAETPARRRPGAPNGSDPEPKPDETSCDLVLYRTEDFVPVLRLRFEDGAFRTFHANRPRASLDPRRVTFLPDGRSLLVGCNGVVQLDAASGRIVRRFDVEPGAATKEQPR